MALVGGDIAAFDISSNSRLLATGAAYDDCISFWDLHRHPPFPLTTLHNNHNDCGVTALRFSPDGTALLAGCNHGTVTLWDVATGVRVAGVQHNTRVTDVAFSRDGALFASASCDTVVHLLKRDIVEPTGIVQGLEPNSSRICKERGGGTFDRAAAASCRSLRKTTPSRRLKNQNQSLSAKKYQVNTCHSPIHSLSSVFAESIEQQC